MGAAEIASKIPQVRKKWVALLRLHEFSDRAHKASDLEQSRCAMGAAEIASKNLQVRKMLDRTIETP